MKQVIQKLGPGLLFAGAAIGVSHLVQSTRSGADFGFGLIWRPTNFNNAQVFSSIFLLFFKHHEPTRYQKNLWEL